MSACFTILGAGGRIGRALVEALAPAHDVRAVDRAALPGFLADPKPAGHVISCIGLTSDFRARPLETAEAHVGLTARLLARGGFESFLYLSSTRVYAGATAGSETTRLSVDPADPSDLYNLTKLAGEALCLSDPRPGVRVARLSNVVAAEPDPDTFLGQTLAEGRAQGRVTIRQAAGSAKDYIALTDVVALLPRIALDGRERLYNVASGLNTTHAEIADWLREKHAIVVDFAPHAPLITFPCIDITRVQVEFGPVVQTSLT
jgi:nucleoside-diphosphate-sugar epimerase